MNLRRGDRTIKISRDLCQMRHTTTMNSLPPIISRVCREARAIATMHGRLHVFPDRQSAGLGRFVPATWLNHARDTLCLHVHAFNSMGHSLPWYTILDNFLHIKITAGFTSAAVSDDLLDPLTQGNGQSAKLVSSLQACPSYLVFTSIVVIHANQSDAIDAGIFGRLGEEPVVLVDAFNAQRIAQYQDFVRTHCNPTKQDPAAASFFDACVNGTPKVHYVETPQELMQDLEVRWLLQSEIGEKDLPRSRWLTTPQSFEGREDDPAAMDYGDLPGRPFARQLWQPNRDDPWVQEKLSRMPHFHPVVMFRLCTQECWSTTERVRRLGPASQRLRGFNEEGTLLYNDVE